MKRIAVYSHSVAPSIDGVCRRYTAILHELVRMGYDVLLFTIETAPEDLPEGIKICILDHMIMPAYPGKKVARPTWGVVAKVYSALKEHKTELVHIVNDGFSQIFEACGLMLNTPIVGAYHTDILELVQKHNGTLFQQGCVWLKEYVDSLLLDSSATTSMSFKKKLASKHIKADHIIITAVDCKMFAPSKHSAKLRSDMVFGDKNGYLCVYTGRISREKRIDVIIDAVQQIDNCYLAIIGDGPSAPIYAKLHGKENRIFCRPQFLDHSDLADVYASSDLHVSASEFETLGNTVLEAHSCGIPVVVPRTQGFCDTVKHEVDGFLFETGNAEDAKQYILRLKNDAKLTKKMSTAALKAVETNTIERVVLDLLDWYAEGMRESRNRAFISKALGWAILLPTLPFGIFSLRCYDMLMNLIAFFNLTPMFQEFHDKED